MESSLFLVDYVGLTTKASTKFLSVSSLSRSGQVPCTKSTHNHPTQLHMQKDHMIRPLEPPRLCTCRHPSPPAIILKHISTRRKLFCPKLNHSITITNLSGNKMLSTISSIEIGKYQKELFIVNTH
ncbi:hypothetical protein V6Z11_A09G178100 [Gossypium hirsutum]